MAAVVFMRRICTAALVLPVALGFRASARVIPATRMHGTASRWRMLSGGASAGGGQPLPLAARLSKLRELMASEGFDALIVPSDDPHLSEYPPACFNRREFISGFTGSAGTAVVTQTEALLWTDGRYFLQAELELSADWTLMKQGQAGVPDVASWLAAAPAPAGAARYRVGYDPIVHSLKGVETLASTIEPAMPAPAPVRTLAPTVSGNLVDVVWGDARPPPPAGAVRAHPMRWAGESVASKLGRMRAVMQGADALLIVALDEVAWLLNLRGADLPTTPVPYAYAIVTAQSAHVFLDTQRLEPALRAQLEEARVEAKPYDEVFETLARLGHRKSTVLVDASRANAAVIGALVSTGGAYVSMPSPPMVAKAIKNGAELDGMREAHLRDAAALCAAFAWLEDAHAAGEPIDEFSLGERFGTFRQAQPGWLCDSFPIIVGAGPNGAIIHYRAEPATCARLDACPSNRMVLIDSGGQYDCGTTDVTRTIHLGEPTRLQRECFTRVLKGNIALDSCVFPEGTPGFVVDVLARRSLWEAGLDYQHGTGHGVGAGLGVHEGPQSISTRYVNTEPLCAGMILSNEPGFYDTDKGFGIRIENLLIVEPRQTEHHFAGKQFLGFAKLTHVPIQRSLLEPSLLSADDVDWLDRYHAQIRDKVLPRVSGRAREWLLRATEPLGLVFARPAAAAATAAASA